MPETIKRLKDPKVKKPKAQWRRPSRIRLEILFGEDNRKVTPADLEAAAKAGAAAVRTSLESHYKPYSVAEINGEVDYSYVQSQKQFRA